MDNATQNERKKVWSSYWAGGALHSCIGSYTDNYSGAIGDFWKARFQGLRSGSRVLDLATGNGALPLLLRDYAGTERQIRIDAVDLAEVAPRWLQPSQHADITFHSGVAMEDLPFPDQSFDLVVSQFGLEYARWPQALYEILRVGQPEGAAAFVMHHADSVLVKVGRAERANQQLLLQEDGLLNAVDAVIPWIARARSGATDMQSNAEALACRQRYNKAMNRLADEIEASPAPDLLIESRDWVHGLVSGANGVDPGLQLSLLANYRQVMQAAMLRTSEMIEHALDPIQANGLLDVFREHRPGHDMECRPISQKEGILGWAVVMGPATN
ncbi:MAG: class I SAM-dependent methyltransferase [Pseudoxanthomonas sp.]